MDLGLLGKTVLVTGGSRNIGRAIAAGFGAEGATVAVGYHSDEAGAARTAELVEKRGGRASTVRIDLGDQASVEAAAAEVVGAYGGVDVLVNNAVAWPGFPAPGEVFETAPVAMMRASLEANLLGHYVLSRTVVGPMRRNGWGRIVHISTGLVEDGRPGSSSYVTPKSGLHGLARTMSRELAGAGILTNVVMSGFVVDEHDMPEEVIAKAAAAAATKRTTTAAEVAAVVVFLCSAANGAVTGELVRADGHLLAPL
ncbi:beta-ketoacyl-ACP reductase [Sphaerisporangium krabiense]|uniref:3-oxoacyl-[acyl-carrier protein] reductase n=1 Tax=Sphaerisporangium krabiense TaxID=763782 RepID=A0A7W9DR74_9ACTN|nr:SDR family oxidoreductase [Sphaerisporangium krabiense]MBB5627774.1 3-oxoacyl-[acyl-carrier protein] reductase [Sphaerisporangium krabiense]GII61933.1 beta-ketoacyl-ACP reductase [Sphaerisporangium krabiense]